MNRPPKCTFCVNGVMRIRTLRATWEWRRCGVCKGTGVKTGAPK